MSVKPKISQFFTPIKLAFPRNVWICLSAKTYCATIEFWYKSYRPCEDIKVLRLASQNITSPPKKKCFGSQTNTNFAVKNICNPVCLKRELDGMASVRSRS